MNRGLLAGMDLDFLNRLGSIVCNSIFFLTEGNKIPRFVQLLRDGTAEGKSSAAGTLRNLANNNNQNKVTIAAAGAIPPLIQLLRDGTTEGKTNAAGALGNLACNNENKVTIAAAGGIPPLIQLLRDGTAEGKTNAGRALWNLAANIENQVTIAAAGAIPLLIQLLRDGTAEGKTNAGRALWNLAANIENQVTIAAAGAIPLLIQLLQDGTAEGKYSAAGALNNLAVNIENQVTIAAAGGIPPLIQLLREGTAEGKSRAAGALGNLVDIDNDAVLLPLVRAALQYGCCICMEEGAREAGMLCPDNGKVAVLGCSYFTCWSCLQQSFTAASKPDAIAGTMNADGLLLCANPQCKCPVVRKALVDARAPDDVMEAQHELHVHVRISREVQQALALQKQQIDAEYARIERIKDEHEKAAAKLHQKLIEEVLTLRCPRCSMAFVDFEGCFALTCGNNQCRAAFCAWCLADCGADAHTHVAGCAENAMKGNMYGTMTAFQAHHRARRARTGGRASPRPSSRLKPKASCEIYWAKTCAT